MVSLGLIALAALGGPGAAANAALIHSFDSYFGSGLQKPEAIAVDQTTGDVYVIEHNAGCVARYKGRGGEALTGHVFPATGTNKICGLTFRQEASEAGVAIDNSGTATQGTIYVTTFDETPTGGVQSYDIDGNHLGNLPQHRLGSGLVYQCGVTTDEFGNVYVAEHYSGFFKYKHNNPVTDADFEGGPDVGPLCPIAIDRFGTRYYGHTPGGSMVKQGSEEPFGFVLTEIGTAVGIDPSSDDAYISEGPEVTAFSSDGILFDTFGLGRVSDSRGVAVDGLTGVAYVSDTANNRIAMFNGEAAYKLSVEPGGTGLGSVTADKAPVEGCGDEGQCTGFYTPSNVVLTATPQPHSVIGAWIGCDSVNPAGDKCTVDTSTDKEVVATFTRIQQPLTVDVTGTGAGSVSTPNKLGLIQGCGDGGACTGPYDEGSVVSLIPTPTGHSSFTGWSGACTNKTGNCKVVMNGGETVTANFTAQHQIGVSKVGSGAGSVFDKSGSLVCGGQCIVYFTDGDTVMLSAIAAEHSKFAGFSGEGCSGSFCEVTAGGSLRKVSATFVHDPATPVTLPGATFVGQRAGTVHATVNPEGAHVTSCFFEYGPTTAYGSTTNCAPSDPGAGTSSVEVGANLTDLAAGTVYHYRVRVTNSGGTTHGEDQSFRTLEDSCDSNATLCPPPKPRAVPTPTCRKGFVLKKDRCVRKKKQRKHRRHQRRANGGGR